VAQPDLRRMFVTSQRGRAGVPSAIPIYISNPTVVDIFLYDSSSKFFYLKKFTSRRTFETDLSC
jgi:hypothetical protein